MDRNYLKGRDGDRPNAVHAAGYNFGPLLERLEVLWRGLLAALVAATIKPQAT
jgi:hypothetical protein